MCIHGCWEVSRFVHASVEVLCHACTPGWICINVHSSAEKFYRVWLKRHRLDCRWRGDSAFSPEASITIHYYSALPVCKCFLTTRDFQPARFPRSPSAEADNPGWTVNARVGKKAHHRNMMFPPLTREKEKLHSQRQGVPLNIKSTLMSINHCYIKGERLV